MKRLISTSTAPTTLSLKEVRDLMPVGPAQPLPWYCARPIARRDQKIQRELARYLAVQELELAQRGPLQKLSGRVRDSFSDNRAARQRERDRKAKEEEVERIRGLVEEVKKMKSGLEHPVSRLASRNMEFVNQRIIKLYYHGNVSRLKVRNCR